VAAFAFRSLTLWLLGYPEAALTDCDNALKNARDVGQAATLMMALAETSPPRIFCSDNVTANTQADELVELANEKSALYWKALGMSLQGWLLVLTGKAAEAVQMITSGIKAEQSTGATFYKPSLLSHLAESHANLGELDDAWRCIDEAMTVMQASK